MLLGYKQEITGSVCCSIARFSLVREICHVITNHMTYLTWTNH